MKIARVFPRRTRATPDDALAFVGVPDLLTPDIDAVHISVAFTWDLSEAERLARVWRDRAPVTIGGPATGEPGGTFAPGQYLKRGYVITSRGCPNQCWFCSVPKREGGIRELPITEGWNVFDDNLLACSTKHLIRVFDMLARQSHTPEFTGGLEAARLTEWIAIQFAKLKPKQLFFAYDTPDDYEPLVAAGRLMRAHGFTAASHRLRAYVLIGYPRDTFEAAEMRLKQTVEAGFFPMAMLWRDETGKRDPKWVTFQRLWANPTIIGARQESRPCPP